MAGTRTIAFAGPVATNAIRLLDDARILRKSRRYASAAALAILSLEETAKFVLTESALADKVLTVSCHAGRPYSHKQKQKAVGEILVGLLLISEIDDLLNTQGLELAILPSGSGAIRAVVETFAGIADDNFREKIKGKLKRANHIAYVVDLLGGRFEKIKHACFYVDLKADGSVSNLFPPANRVVADKMLSLAQSAINTTRSAIRGVNKRNSYHQRNSLRSARARP